ncbi:MAG: four helix bundle protein [Acidobacteria bacterium]|nr:MAG: four helix bundle protein [Acidobacteriota bacterium]
MEKQTDLGERIVEFAVRIVKVVGSMPNTLVGRRIGDQFLRRGLSTGANFEEAQAAESRADFAHKLQIALKEARESNYWLRVVSRSGTVRAARLESLIQESRQLVAMLSKAVARARGVAKGPKPQATSG